MAVKGGYSSVLEAAAMAMAGDGCCSMRGANDECCMSDNARGVFRAIHDAGGPTLEQIEAWAAGRPVAVPQREG